MPLRLPFDPFGPIAPVYERLHARVAEEGLRRLLDLEPGMRVLDLGGGTGKVARRFLKEGVSFLILDPSSGMLSQARHLEGVRPIRGVAEALPFPNRCFDRVLCVDAFHHFRDHAAAVSEVARVLAPEGRFVVQEFNVNTLRGKLIRAGEAALLLGSVFRSPQELLVLLAETGLSGQVYNDGDLEYFLVAHKDSESDR